jgi:broad specificity phosphatase PhoE
MHASAMNHLEGLARLNNDYFGLRHGESRANKKKRINYNVLKSYAYPITDTGKSEVDTSLDVAVKDGLLEGKKILIRSGKLRRHRQTARRAKKRLQKLGYDVITPVKASGKLNERKFGVFKSTDNYRRVWQKDKEVPRDTQWYKDTGVATPEEEVDQKTALVKEIEDAYTGIIVILVSSGDPLAFIQTAFEGKSPSEHRSLNPIKTGELRRLVLRRGEQGDRPHEQVSDPSQVWPTAS